MIRIEVVGDRRVREGLRHAGRQMKLPKDALKRAADEVVLTASRLAARRTGKLSRSNRARVTANRATVSNRIRYATYQEHGTRVMRAHPFLRPALSETHIEQIFQDYADDVLDRNF